MPTKIVYKLYNLLGVAATLTAVTCWACGTIEETAYVGTVEIHYPDTGQKLDGRGQSQQCIWTISAYKKDLVVYLEFIDVNLSANLLNDTCLNNIKVYDGSEISDNRLAIICGNDEPTLVTSSRYTMVVFTSNASSGYDGSFRLRYKAVKERLSQTDSSQTLRIAFGGFIGAIACVVICSGGIRRYMKSRPSRSLHFFLGGHRINIGPTEGASARSSRRAAHTQDTPSVGKRVTQFFQSMVARIRGVNSPGELARWTSDTAPGAAGDASTAHAHSADPQDLDEHDSFGYQAIPVASFTSDPAAVKPPTYEESISNLNPLYLNPLTGQAFYNNGFQIKDEDRGFVPGFSPPPPYSESYTSHDVPSEGGVMHICTGPNFRTCQINTHTVETLTPLSLTPSTEALTNRVPGSTEVTQKTTEISGHDVEPSACALFPDLLHTSSASAKNVPPNTSSLDMDNIHTTHRNTASTAKPSGTDSTTIVSTFMVDTTAAPTTAAYTTLTHTNTTPPTIAPTSHTEPTSASSSEPDLPHPTDTHTTLVSDITHNTSPHTREQETDEPQNFETLTIDCFHSNNDHDA